MKKNNLAVFLLLFMVLFLPINIKAQTSDEITDSEKIKEFLEIAPQEYIDLYNEGNLHLTKDNLDENGDFLPIDKVLSRYMEVNTHYVNGVAVESKSTDITKEKYESSKQMRVVDGVQAVGNCSGVSMVNDCWETNSKRLTLAVISNPSFPNVKIEVINTWKSIPSVKSYDSIGVFFNGGFNRTSANGYQYYNGSSISYSYGGTNMKLASNGVSISQDIVDSTTYGLSNYLWVYGSFTSTPYQITASYQHAVNNISLATSQNFNFSSSGMGHVFGWNTSYSNWDNMQGVCANLSSGTSGYLWYC